MAVPIQVVQEKKASPESPKPSTSETEPSAEYITPGNGAQDSLKKLTSYWYQANSEDEFPPKKHYAEKQNCNLSSRVSESRSFTVLAEGSLGPSYF